MAPRPWSERFLLMTVPATWVSYTVPAGYRAVVRSITCVSAGTGALVQVAAAGGNLLYHVFQAGETTRNYDLRAVLYQHEAIMAYVSPLNTHAYISGYLFEDASGLTSAPGDVDLVADEDAPEILGPHVGQV